MKTQHLTGLLLASTACAQKTKEHSDEFNCTHWMLGSPKSRTTSVARALCHALQKEGNTSCIHEPIRVRHEMNLLGYESKIVPYHSKETTFCKDMLFHTHKTAVHRKKIEQAIKASENAIVLLKNDPVQSFLSMVDLRFKELEQRYNNVKPLLNGKHLVDQFCVQALDELAGIASGNSVAYSTTKAFAQHHNKTVVELKDENFSKNATAEINKALASWKKKLASESQALKMAPNLYVDRVNTGSKNNFTNSYQHAMTDLWDTSHGEVFDPSIRKQSRDEKLQSLMDKHVAGDTQAYFKTRMESYFQQIEKSTAEAENKYDSTKKRPSIPSIDEHNEL